VEEEEGKRQDSRGQETGISRGTSVSNVHIIFLSDTSHFQSTRDNAPPNCAHRTAATPVAHWDVGLKEAVKTFFYKCCNSVKMNPIHR